MLGLVTIGQSPRDDVTTSMFGDDAPACVEAGALDQLDDQTIAALAPADDEHVLVTRLVGGREVLVAKERLLPHVQTAVDRVVHDGASIVCILCTGAFPELTSTVPLVFPDRLLTATFGAVMPSGRVGVLMPHPGQHASMVDKWTTDSRSVVTASVSPYAGDSGVGAAARQLVADGADAIVMDCMGFDRRMLADARCTVDVPVVLANGLVGAVLREMIGS